MTSWAAACRAPLSSTISRSLLKFKPIESVMLSNHLILSSPFSFCLQSFPASGSFPMSQFFTSVDLSIEALASATVLPVNIQGWFPLGLTGLISLMFKGLSRRQCKVEFWEIVEHTYSAMRPLPQRGGVYFPSRLDSGFMLWPVEQSGSHAADWRSRACPLEASRL